MEYNNFFAQIIADSINPAGNRLTTFIVTFPRIVLAEFNTHRQFSRNSASSRAIPFEKMKQRAISTPFVPLKFQKHHTGMQGTEFLEGEYEKIAVSNWLEARAVAVSTATQLYNSGVTKQLCNRLLEPFLWHTVIVTATEWENFFALRCHPAAEIHISEIAGLMLTKYNESEPKQLKEGEWHVPFGDNFDIDRIKNTEQFKEKLSEHEDNSEDVVLDLMKVAISVSRCARISYLNFEGKDDYDADIKLHDTLAKSGHFSPHEHCAIALATPEPIGNFVGFLPYRKLFNNECRTDDRVINKK